MNVARNLVDRDARRATRLLHAGAATLRSIKGRVKADFRGQVRRALLDVRRGADADAIDFQPRKLATGWDVA